jgi:hypothetical protein
MKYKKILIKSTKARVTGTIHIVMAKFPIPKIAQPMFQ